jgi:hypothetical protein
MSWRLRLSVETIVRLTPAVLGSAVFSIAGYVGEGLASALVGGRLDPSVATPVL